MLDLINARHLILRLHIRKTCLKVTLFLVVRIERKALGLFPLDIERQQFVCHIPHRTAHVVPGLLPLRRGQPAQLYVGILTGSDILGHHIQLRDRHIQIFLTGILDGDIILGHALQFQLADAQKAPDAVQSVYHQISRRNVCQGAYLFPTMMCLSAACAGTQRSRLGNQRRLDLRIGKPTGKAAGAEIDRAVFPDAVRLRQFAADAAFPEILLQNRQRFFTAGIEHGAVALLTVGFQILCQLTQLTAPGRILHRLDAEQFLKFHVFAALQKVAEIHLKAFVQLYGNLRGILIVALQPTAKAALFQQQLAVLLVLRHQSTLALHDCAVFAPADRPDAEIIEHGRLFPEQRRIFVQMHRKHPGVQLVGIGIQLFPCQVCPAAAQGFS